MAKKPTILQAQNLPFMQLFGACMVDASKKYAIVAVILGSIIGVFCFLAYYGHSIWNAISSGFWAVMSFLQLGAIVTGIFSVGEWAVMLVWNTYITVMNASYAFTERLLPGILTFTAITCETVQQAIDGKEASVTVCNGITNVHFVAQGVYLGIGTSLGLLGVVSAIWLVLRAGTWLKNKKWDSEDSREFWSFFFRIAMPLVAIGVFLATVLTGVTYGLAMPTLKQVFHVPVEYSGAFFASFLIMLVIFVAPPAVLQWLMWKYQKEALQEAEKEHDKMQMEGLFSCWEEHELDTRAKDLLREPIRMVIYRTSLMVLGATAFLIMVKFGAMFWANPLAVSIVAILAFGVVAITLACVVTCYPSLKEGYHALKIERGKMIEAYAAEQLNASKRSTDK